VTNLDFTYDEQPPEKPISRISMSKKQRKFCVVLQSQLTNSNRV